MKVVGNRQPARVDNGSEAHPTLTQESPAGRNCAGSQGGWEAAAPDG